MTIKQSNTTPFSEQLFDVQLTGLELAALGILAGAVSGKPKNSIREITDPIWKCICQYMAKSINTTLVRSESVSLEDSAINIIKKAIDN